jgi:hypothetical protein
MLEQASTFSTAVFHHNMIVSDSRVTLYIMVDSAIRINSIAIFLRVLHEIIGFFLETIEFRADIYNIKF